MAKIAYPGNWFTVTSPAAVACQYFDPKPITVPADPTTLKTAVMARNIPTSYADAVATATNTANWNVAQKTESTVGSVPVTCVAATATNAAAGIPVGTGAFSCLANVGAAGTVVISTNGPPTDPTFQSNAAVVGLMTQASTFTPS